MLVNEYRELVTVVSALVMKLRHVEQNPAYRHVWEFYATHGLTYQGPKYTDELAGVELVLRAHAEQLRALLPKAAPVEPLNDSEPHDVDGASSTPGP